MTTATIIGRECRFAVYCPPAENTSNCLHTIKEILHYSDGTTKPNLRLVRNFKRPFYITQKGHRNHEQKKEWTDLSTVTKYESTQANLVYSISKALGEPWFRGDARKQARSPFLYGSDILSTAVIKRSYQDKYPTLITPYSVSTFDVETDVVHGTDQITMGTLAYGSKVFTAIQRSFVAGHADALGRLPVLLNKYLSTYVEKREIQWEVVLVDSEADVIIECFKRAHVWQPDFVAIWNINFDLPKMLTALERANIDPKDVFSDPSVPAAYRHFKYKQGSSKKVMASGKVTPIKPSAQWHTAYCPSSFYFIDAMCAYKHIRIGSQEEPSYSLDNILQKHLGIRKLKFKEAEGLTGIDWHQFMQERHPLEYVIYNVFDCVSMEELDEVTTDLRLTLPLFSGCSDFANFKSQPRRLVDNLHYFCLEHGKVIGSTSDQMTDELDPLTIDIKDWIN